MKSAEELYEKQLEKLCNDVEGMLNDFESGITEKEDTIKNLANYIIQRVINTIGNDRQQIIALIDEMIDNAKQALSSKRQTQAGMGGLNMLILKLTELKNKIEVKK